MTGTDATWVTQFLGEELTAEENRLETCLLYTSDAADDP